MPRPWQHARTYHPWPSTTPVVDAVIAVIAFASVVIGAHAALFLAFAANRGDTAAVVDNALFFVAIGAANALAELVRRWRRHHG
jgi:hypothetical protein